MLQKVGLIAKRLRPGNGLWEQQPSSNNYWLRTGIRNKYGDVAPLLQELNPDAQIELCRDEDLCYRGEFPTLAELRTGYGDNIPVAWLIPQLYTLSEYSGCRDKLSEWQLMKCAESIIQEHYDLKVSELMLFFSRYCAGRYGHFYGAVDPMLINEKLLAFRRERKDYLDKYEQEESRRRRDQALASPTNKSFTEWLPERNLYAYIFWRFEGRLRGLPRPIVCGRRLGSNDKPRHIFRVDEDWSELKGRIRD